MYERKEWCVREKERDSGEGFIYSLVYLFAQCFSDLRGVPIPICFTRSSNPPDTIDLSIRQFRKKKGVATGHHCSVRLLQLSRILNMDMGAVKARQRASRHATEFGRTSVHKGVGSHILGMEGKSGW
jgi:hypothetical protein